MKHEEIKRKDYINSILTEKKYSEQTKKSYKKRKKGNTICKKHSFKKQKRFE